MQQPWHDLYPQDRQPTQAGDFMRIGKWMMLPIRDTATLEDFKMLAAVKLPPKAKVAGLPA